VKKQEEITMQVFANPKEKIHTLANEMSDLQLTEVANYMQFIQSRGSNDTFGVLKLSENTLDFWDNDDDKVWDSV
jgi:hypothetical protein